METDAAQLLGQEESSPILSAPEGAAETPNNRDIHQELVDIIDKPAWKAILMEIVKAEDIDPWDIDIQLLTSRYVQKIREMKTLNFRVPANAVLASAILVRFKSESWELYPQEEFEEQLEEQTDWEYIIEGQRVPELDNTRRITRRRVTIEELIKAVEDVMDKEKKRAQKMRMKRVVPQDLMDIAFEDREDSELIINSVYNRIIEMMDSQRLACFSDLLVERSRQELVQTLLPLLHLANQHKIDIWQEKHFGEIFISVPEDGTDEKAAASTEP